MIHMDYMMYCFVNGFLQMSDLKNELDKEWPSLEEEENEKIWKKEWERHGICSEPLLTQHAFFETALKLKQTYDLFNILANRGVCFQTKKVMILTWRRQC